VRDDPEANAGVDEHAPAAHLGDRPVGVPVRDVAVPRVGHQPDHGQAVGRWISTGVLFQSWLNHGSYRPGLMTGTPSGRRRRPSGPEKRR
jgi:hypothetical protein